MVKLSLNEEEVRKKLEDFPLGVKAIDLEKSLEMSKTSLYECLNRLENFELAYREHGLWYPKKPSESSIEKAPSEIIEKDNQPKNVIKIPEDEAEIIASKVKIADRYDLDWLRDIARYQIMLRSGKIDEFLNETKKREKEES